MPLIRLTKPNRPKYVISDGITQSMLSAFLTCRQKSTFQIEGWENSGTNNSAYQRGDYFHYLLEMWYSGKITKGLVYEEGLIDVFINKCEHLWIKKQSKTRVLNQDDLIETFSMAYAIFPEYVKYWRASDINKTWEELEQVFDTVWQGYRLRGKRDGLFKYIKQGSRWLFETKTKGAIEEELMLDILGFDFQNLFYLTNLKIENKPASGVVYNIIRKPSLKQHKKETKEEFIARIAEDVKTRPKHYFKRYEVAYAPQMVNSFEAQLKMKLDLFKEVIEGRQPIFRNESACTSTWMKCPYIKACSSGNLFGYTQTREMFRELQPD